MNDLNRALTDIRDIRRQVAHSTEFRGYGPFTLCVTAAFALIAGIVQSAWIIQPQLHPSVYAALWSSTAILSAALIATQTLTRAQRMHSALADDMIRMAIEQFLPAVVAGTLLTILILRSPARIAWLLPGLWQIVYSLGIFSSCRFLPRPMLAAGLWYLAMGLLCVSLGDARALSPALMAGTYAVGQSIVAAVLYIASKGARNAQ